MSGRLCHAGAGGDAVAEDMARVWPAGGGRLGALVQLPALAAQTGDISVVLIEVGLPGGESRLRGLIFARRRILGKGSGGFRRVRPGGAAWEQQDQRQAQERPPAPTPCDRTSVPHLPRLSWSAARVMAVLPSYEGLWYNAHRAALAAPYCRRGARRQPGPRRWASSVH
jgi:hypothetical protein